MATSSDPLENLKNQAKELLRAVFAGTAEALQRVERHHPQFPRIASGVAPRDIKLTGAQLVIAREEGYESWPKMRAALQKHNLPIQWTHTRYETVLRVVKSAAFRLEPQATLEKSLNLEHDQPYIYDILRIVRDCPWMLKEEHAVDWDALIWDTYFAPDYGEYLPENE